VRAEIRKGVYDSAIGHYNEMRIIQLYSKYKRHPLEDFMNHVSLCSIIYAEVRGKKRILLA